MIEKKYLVSGLKDGQEYFYKDLEAHGKVDSLKDNVTDLKTDFVSLSSSVSSALKDKVSTSYFDSTVTELNNKIDGIKIPDEFKYENIKDDVETAIKTAADNTWAQHSATLAKVEREIKRFHHQGQSFEVRGLPDGSLVDYNCKEIRIMCPADTDWENYHIDLKKNFEDDDLEQFRFIEFVAYAPEGAGSYKEKVSHDYPEKLYESSFKVPFVENDPYDYAGIDSDERKYSLYYFPVAQKVDGQWNYLGNISTIEDYNGWYYSIEWYDEENQNKIVKASTVRVNLSGADNFRYIEPIHEHSIWNLIEKTLPKFEVADLPEKSIVKEREKELRIYCPENIDWTKYIHNWVDETLPNADKENYIFAHIKAFAPKEAIYFRAYRESTGVTDYNNENYFKFTGVNQSIDPENPELFGKSEYKLDEKGNPERHACGIDKYGRNYVSFWPAIAQKDNDTWVYSGNTSSSNHFVGYTYTFEWYNNNKELIDIDTVRFNLVKTLIDLKDMRTHMLIESQRQ